MNPWLLATGLVLAMILLAALVRAVRGPSPVDRMLAAQLLGTTGVAFLAVWGAAAAKPDAVDVALVFALLAVVTIVAFVRRGWTFTSETHDDHP